MIPEERSDLAALHALALLEGAELAKALHLEATDPEFAAEVASNEESIARLAEAMVPVQPSDLLRERVLSLAKKKPKAGPHYLSWIGWAAAAALALSTAALWTKSRELKFQVVQISGELNSLRSKNQFDGLRIASLEGQLDAFKGTRAVVVWNQSLNEGQITLTNLPSPEAGKDYQLWIVDPAHEHPVSGGLIHRNEDGTANVPFQPVQIITNATAFAISVERAGGVEVGEGPIVFLGK